MPDIHKLVARDPSPCRACVHRQEVPVNDTERQRVEEILHGRHVGLAPRLEEGFAIEQALLDAELRQLGGKRVVVAQEIQDIARVLVDEPEDDVHDLDGGVHGVGETAFVIVDRVTEEEEDRLVLADLLEVPRVFQDRLQVAHVGMQVTDDDKLALLRFWELNETAGPSIRGRRPQGSIEGKDGMDRILQLRE
jgi:hypothetical protein